MCSSYICKPQSIAAPSKPFGGGLFTRKQQQEKEYDPDYASMTPVVHNIDQNSVIRVVSSGQPSYTQGPIQHGKGTVNKHIFNHLVVTPNKIISKIVT